MTYGWSVPRRRDRSRPIPIPRRPSPLRPTRDAPRRPRRLVREPSQSPSSPSKPRPRERAEGQERGETPYTFVLQPHLRALSLERGEGRPVRRVGCHRSASDSDSSGGRGAGEIFPRSHDTKIWNLGPDRSAPEFFFTQPPPPLMTANHGCHVPHVLCCSHVSRAGARDVSRAPGWVGRPSAGASETVACLCSRSSSSAAGERGALRDPIVLTTVGHNQV